MASVLRSQEKLLLQKQQVDQEILREERAKLLAPVISLSNDNYRSSKVGLFSFLRLADLYKSSARSLERVAIIKQNLNSTAIQTPDPLAGVTFALIASPVQSPKPSPRLLQIPGVPNTPPSTAAVLPNHLNGRTSKPNLQKLQEEGIK
ncbi:hypothetical protein HK096_008211 [Nowakowskiella sp. JEL0078]|nr:hypothetical protein HK096_008211 [Nowakowskiella sp. JEL0078]